MPEGPLGGPRPFAEGNIVLEVRGRAVEPVKKEEVFNEIMLDVEVDRENLQVTEEEHNILLTSVNLGDEVLLNIEPFMKEMIKQHSVKEPPENSIQFLKEQIEAVYEENGLVEGSTKLVVE